MFGFLGLGSMGTAIVRGALAAGELSAADILFTRRTDAAAQALQAELGITRATSNPELVSQVGPDGVIMIGVKPHMVAGVLAEIKDAAAQHKSVIVSMATGTPLEKMAAELAPEQPIIRVMPNVNMQIGLGMTALCANEYVSTEQFDQVERIFAAAGETVRLPEAHFSAYAAIAGCSGAWTWTYIDALSRAALAAGITKADSLRIAAQAVMGSAALALNKMGEVSPMNLVDEATSPGGTTIAGLIALEKSGFSSAAIDAVQAAVARDAEIAAE